MKNDLARGRIHRLPGEEISWVGECPWVNALSFATESGNFYPDENTEPVHVADEAINGVGFSGEFAAFSSRSSIWAAQRSSGDRLDLFGWSFGAHGVVASRDGTFFAPAGPAGIFAIRPKADEIGFEGNMFQRAGDPLYAYELVRVGNSGSSDVLALAARGQGMLVFSYQGGRELSPASKQFVRGYDIVSVSPLNDPEFPLGVVALSRKGEVVVILDTLGRGKPRVVNYPEIQGSPYAICAAKGHLFILTSKEHVAIPDFTKHIAAQESSRNTYQSWVLPIEATDMIYQGGNRLMILMNGEAGELNINELVAEWNSLSGNVVHTHSNGVLEPELPASLLNVEWGAEKIDADLAGV